MLSRPRLLLLACAAVALCASNGVAQKSTDKKPEKKSEKNADKKVDTNGPNPPMFRTETPLELTFTTNIKQIKRDRQDNAPWRAASMTYKDSAGTAVTVPMRARTRGIWRLKNCDFPPIRLKIADKDGRKTLFANTEEPKLVTYCRNSDQYDTWVLQELQLYRAYRLITEASHKVRLVKMSYADSATGKIEAVRWSFIIEDPAQVAQRLGGGIVKMKGATAEDLDPAISALAFTFQYFAANTDFSFYGLHNGEILMLADGRNIPIAYDFDFSGAVNASYASADPKLPIKSVRERLFRGYCAHNDAYPAAWELFRSKREAIDALYADPIGKLLPGSVTQMTLRYFNDFWQDIRTTEQGKRKLLNDCLK